MFRHIFILSMLFCLAFPYGTNAKGLCLSDVEARTLVQMHKLISVNQALTAARSKAKGDLISAHLCQIPDGFMYKVAIIKYDGRVVKLLIDANSGQIVE